MIYTKDNINGVKFYSYSDPNTIYTIDLSKNKNVSWGKNGSTNISVQSIIESFNKKWYIPVERNELYLIHN